MASFCAVPKIEFAQTLAVATATLAKCFACASRQRRAGLWFLAACEAAVVLGDLNPSLSPPSFFLSSRSSRSLRSRMALSNF